MKNRKVQEHLALIGIVALAAVAAFTSCDNGNNAGTAPAITTATLPGGTVGTAYSQTLAATGDTPITWAVDADSTLPGGLTLSTAGVISGTPTAAGTFDFTVRATNSAGDDTQVLSIVIASAAPAGTARQLPPHTADGTWDCVQPRTTGRTTDDTPITWAVDADSTLPGGLTLSSAGVIAGTPTTAGTFNFTVRATNSAGDDTQALSIVIAAAGQITVASTADWNTALATIRAGGSNKTYTLNVTGDVSVQGMSNTLTSSVGFGSNNTNVTVTLIGDGTLSLTDTSSMLVLGSGHTLIIDSEDLTLQGYATSSTSVGVLRVANGTLELRNGTITGHNAGGSYGAVYTIGTNAAFTMSGGEISDNDCAGVYVYSGTFIMSGGKISGNTPTGNGGGVYLSNQGAAFTMTGGEISGNTVTSSGGGGGGVFVAGVASAVVPFNMSGGKINNNTAPNGAGVYLSGGCDFIMTGGEINDNVATGTTGGGGVRLVSGCTFTLEDGTISGNSALAGGGVYTGSRFTMKGGTISGNTATTSSTYNGGGGVYTSTSEGFSMEGGTISGNTTNSRGGSLSDKLCK